MGIDQLKADENIEGTKLEWGPTINDLSWNDTQAELAKLNAKQKNGEKLWRLPTTLEILDNLDADVQDSRRYCWASQAIESVAYAVDTRGDNLPHPGGREPRDNDYGSIDPRGRPFQRRGFITTFDKRVPEMGLIGARLVR